MSVISMNGLRSQAIRRLPEYVIKRNEAVVPFNLERVRRAVRLCYEALDERPKTGVEEVVSGVVNTLSHRYAEEIPTVEQIQDLVELTLLSVGEFEAAHRYITYREQHRKDRVVVPQEVQDAFAADKEFFPHPLQQFMLYDKYSRYNWDLGRRETWVETVDRAVDYLRWLSEDKLDGAVYERIRYSIRRLRVMPSMRLLAMAGDAAKRDSTSVYNCSYMTVDTVDCFPEAMLISMAGCGIGYSVERKYVEQFPRILRQSGEMLPTHYIEDSAQGWAAAVKLGIQTWFSGKDIEFDYSFIRPAGAPLKTKGGRASGSGPLRDVLVFCRSKILSRQGSFLRPIDAHDMMCVVAGAAVSGGVRRTAALCLFDFDDVEMRSCKDGANLENNQHRWNANNSAVWPETITQLELIDQMTEMYRNQRGEPGIFSRANATKTMPDRRDKNFEFGTNPCGEIVLRATKDGGGFCNLSIAVARPNDTQESLADKVEVATIIGTIQSMATNFMGLRPGWKKNAEEERLLGVDISGQQDCSLLVEDDGSLLSSLKQVAIRTNEEYAKKLGINPSAAITCNKPNGNSSQLLNCSSGIHRRWAPYYIRNVRVSPFTPLYRVLRDAGVPMDPENGQNKFNATSWVVHFPIKAPEGTKTKNGYSAVEQCEYWLKNKLFWTEHNPSCTITYQPEELLDLMSWVWDHRDVIGGLSFLPASDAKYAQMPYEEISKEEYERLIAQFPPIDFSLLYSYERTDMTEAAQTLACTSGQCEL